MAVALLELSSKMYLPYISTNSQLEVPVTFRYDVDDSLDAVFLRDSGINWLHVVADEIAEEMKETAAVELDAFLDEIAKGYHVNID